MERLRGECISRGEGVEKEEKGEEEEEAHAKKSKGIQGWKDNPWCGMGHIKISEIAEGESLTG